MAACDGIGDHRMGAPGRDVIIHRRDIEVSIRIRHEAGNLPPCRGDRDVRITAFCRYYIRIAGRRLCGFVASIPSYEMWKTVLYCLTFPDKIWKSKTKRGVLIILHDNSNKYLTSRGIRGRIVIVSSAACAKEKGYVVFASASHQNTLILHVDRDTLWSAPVVLIKYKMIPA